MSTSASAIATTMVNAAFLQEVKDSNLCFWQNLHDFKRAIATDGLPSEQACILVKLLSELRDAIAIEFSLEETYGYIEGSQQSASGTATKAATAKMQHCELYLQLHEISEMAEEAQYRGTIASEYSLLVSACKDFLSRLEQHERLESELIRYEMGIGRFGRP